MQLGIGRNTPQPVPFQNVQWVRYWDTPGTRWCDIHKADGVFNWATLDAYVKQDKAAGRKILYCVGGTAPWCAIPVPNQPTSAIAGNPQGNLPPTQYGHEQFVDAFTARYVTGQAVPQIDAIEVWNEFTAEGFWYATTSAAVTQLYTMAAYWYGKVKIANANVLIGSPSAPWNDNALDWIAAMKMLLAAGFGMVVDAFCIHGYLPAAYGGSATAPIWAGGGNTTDAAAIAPVIAAVRELIPAHLQIWDTESGPGANVNYPGWPDPRFVNDWYNVRKDYLDMAVEYQPDNQTHGTLMSTTGVLNSAGEAFAQL